MLMFSGEVKPPALGNFFYSPLRLRPVFEPAGIRSALPASPPVTRRRKKESPLDLEMEHRPSDARESPRTAEHAEEDSPLAKLLSRRVNRETGDESDAEDEEEDEPKPKEKKKKKQRKGKKKDKENGTLDKICRKLKLSYVLVFLGIFVLLACGFLVFLRNRLVACCKKCWPFKRRSKKSNKDMFSLEGGDSPMLSRRSPKSKKKGAAGKTVDTGVPDSRTSLTKSENGKVGCSPCCRKKKKKDKKRRK